MAAEEIKKEQEIMKAAFRNKDASAMADFYTEDCFYVEGANYTIVRGRAGMEKELKTFIDTFSHMEYEPIDLTIREDTATEMGQMTLVFKNSGEKKEFKYMALYVKKGGKWRCHYDLAGTV